MIRRIPPPPPSIERGIANYLFQMANTLNETIAELYNGAFITTDKGTATSAAQIAQKSTDYSGRIESVENKMRNLESGTQNNFSRTEQAITTLREQMANVTGRVQAAEAKIIDLRAEVDAMGQTMHPVGTVYFSTDQNFDPAAAFGGVWEAMTIEQNTGIYAWKCTGEGE